MSKNQALTADAAVVGAGPSGLVAALALAKGGIKTVLFAPPAPPDRRTTALLGGSVRVLEALDVWRNLPAHSCPLEHLRIVDATDRLIRAPEVLFHAGELGLDAFGQNIPNEILRSELLAAAERSPAVSVIAAAADQIIPQDDRVILR
ncbi:MAG: FAD-dependent monooxygenase, partial [Hyphomicrobium sp.]|nr:FAD-dependent monooxygenase [Hyphomicrobium sp.]